jgi:ABC transporter substrate binding protein
VIRRIRPFDLSHARRRAADNRSRTKLVLYTVCTVLLALCSFVEAQQPGKIFRIGFLDSSTASGMAVLVDAFHQELSKLGWIKGRLMSYGADFEDLFRHAAVYVDKILKDAKPADLPVQQATKFEFIVNLKAAKQIDLTIPARVLERANKVIK